MNYLLRKATTLDLEFVLSLNQESLEAVSFSNLEQMYYFLESSSYFKIMIIENKPVGFLIGLMPGLAYESENYRWISKKYNSYVYVDRIIIHRRYRSMGLGFDFYNDLVKSFQGRVDNILCEVNIKPYNAQSLKFHKKYGFKTIGEKDTENGTKRVSYMMYKISPQV